MRALTVHAVMVTRRRVVVPKTAQQISTGARHRHPRVDHRPAGLITKINAKMIPSWIRIASFSISTLTVILSIPTREVNKDHTSVCTIASHHTCPTRPRHTNPTNCRHRSLDKMSQYDTPRQSRAGPQRSDSNARMHSLTKPYQRPAQRDQTNEFGNRSPTKQPISTRPGLSKSASAYSLGTLTRSGSESSMLSGIKSLISRPLGWLTPARKSKKSQDVDAEMGPDSRPGTIRKRQSPSPEQRVKKQRHYSPDHDMEGDYAPSRPNGLPSLGNVSLSRRATPNYSLPTSRSEAYLDMPQNMLQSTKRSGEHYSPWAKQHDGRTRSSITPANFRVGRVIVTTDNSLSSIAPLR